MTIDLGFIGLVGLIGAGAFFGARMENHIGAAVDNYINKLTGGNSNVI